ncbi:glycosyltransferase family 2 protein [Caldimonas manganoxidans]|uniref:glycosyltransferase family 2 protein n=1 Tax=Caldimonas manganoxidans TaxID=196015 RepID=UPI00037C7E7C|nr:glycosyltransferase family 2 protein [Caldimonas manganoxidans]
MESPIDLHPQPRIDVHLLTLDEPAAWREACLASLAGAPIRLHVLPGIPGRIGDARAAGFARGTLPLVSFVDPDDVYEASAFTHLADALDGCPQAVMAYTDEALMDEQGRDVGVRRLAYSAFQHALSASHVHGLIVMRRAAVEAVLAATTDIHPMADWLLTRLVAQRGGVLHLPIVGRHWRQHPRQVHRTADPAVVRRIRQTIDQATNPWR